jgi:DNA mismatch repair protein MutS2
VQIAVFEDVLADLGDSQSLEQSLSTFSGHLQQVTGILRKAGRHSLVLLDELGSGTDPVEGSALAIAILRQLADQASLTFATTHYAGAYPRLRQWQMQQLLCCKIEIVAVLCCSPQRHIRR